MNMERKVRETRRKTKAQEKRARREAWRQQKARLQDCDAALASEASLLTWDFLLVVANPVDSAAEVELLRCDYAPRCSRAGCRPEILRLAGGH